MDNVRARVADIYGTEGHALVFRVYGRDGVMGHLEPETASRPHELGLVIEVVAGEPDTSAAILALAALRRAPLDLSRAQGHRRQPRLPVLAL